MMSSALATSLATYALPFSFSYLVPSVKVTFRGESLCEYTLGETRRTLKSDRGETLRKFVNAAPDRRVLARFIETFGPLDQRAFERTGEPESVRLGPVATQEFRGPVMFASWETGISSVEAWRDEQARFRDLWTGARELPAFELNDGRITFDAGRLTYTTRALSEFLFLSLVTNQPRMRKCERKSCAAPYYFARHGPQRYCTEECAHEAAKESKRDWWNENRGVGSKAGKRGKK